MTLREKADNMATGIASGILLPFITGLIIYLFTSAGLSLHAYLLRIAETNIITHAITLCVFPNVAIFFIFNRFDMLRACRGVLGVTIFWAILVFVIKFI
ncbi:MAG TPA: hypothetical protein VK213_03655 [Bacteroidales bacterium]|nr:hypothetical protein [Bacteroidales bacterium]